MRQRLEVAALAARPLDGAARGVADQVARERRVDRIGRLVRDRALDHDRLCPRQPVIELCRQRVVAGDHRDGHPKRAQVQRVDSGFGDRTAVDLDEDERAGCTYDL